MRSSWSSFSDSVGTPPRTLNCPSRDSAPDRIGGCVRFTDDLSARRRKLVRCKQSYYTRSHFIQQPSNRRCSVYVLIKPGHKEFGDAGTVLLGHELVPITGQPDILESHECGLYTCLIEPLGYAMGVRTVIACLPGHFEDRDTLQVYEFVCGFLLNPAWNEVWPIRFLLANRSQFRWVLDGGS